MLKLLDRKGYLRGGMSERDVWIAHGSPKGKCIISTDGTECMTTMYFREKVMNDFVTPLEDLIEEYNSTCEPDIPPCLRGLVESLKKGGLFNDNTTAMDLVGDSNN